MQLKTLLSSRHRQPSGMEYQWVFKDLQVQAKLPRRQNEERSRALQARKPRYRRWQVSLKLLYPLGGGESNSWIGNNLVVQYVSHSPAQGRREVLVPEGESLVVYHLQQLSRNSGWKVNGTWLFGSFQWKISGRNGTSEKVVLFFQMECSKRKFVYHLFKPHLWYQFQAHTAIFCPNNN